MVNPSQNFVILILFLNTSKAVLVQHSVSSVASKMLTKEMKLCCIYKWFRKVIYPIHSDQEQIKPDFFCQYHEETSTLANTIKDSKVILGKRIVLCFVLFLIISVPFHENESFQTRINFKRCSWMVFLQLENGKGINLNVLFYFTLITFKVCGFHWFRIKRLNQPCTAIT